MALLFWFVAGEIGIRRWNRELANAAREFGGRPAGGESIECSFGGHRAIVRAPWPRYSQSPPTRIDIEAPFGTWLTVHPRGLLGRVFRFLMRARFETGHTEVDRFYEIRAADNAVGRRLASPAVANLLVNLAALDPQIDVRAQGATIRFGAGVDRDAATFRNLLRVVDVIVQALVDPAGVEIGELELHQGRCPTCGEPAEEPLVRCRRCATPQHANCWTYLGGCAMFGCARSAKPPGVR